MNRIIQNKTEIVSGLINSFPYVQNINYASFDIMNISVVSYIGEQLQDTIFYLYCKYNNSYVASFTIDQNQLRNTICPNTSIKLDPLNPNEMTFQIYYFDAVTDTIKPLIEVAFLSVTLNFIKYEK